MTSVQDPPVAQLLTECNHAVCPTLNEDGSIHSTGVWVLVEHGRLAVNSAAGRHWPINLERDLRITVLIEDEHNPNAYVEVRGEVTVGPDPEGHIDRLAKNYLGKDSYPFRQHGERRVQFLVEPTLVRQG